MEFKNLMRGVEETFDLWLKDDQLNEMFNGNVEDLQKEFLTCIQAKINSNFIMLTQDELQKKLSSYHRSMEGYEQ